MEQLKKKDIVEIRTKIKEALLKAISEDLIDERNNLIDADKSIAPAEYSLHNQELRDNNYTYDKN